jgi:hypothetical protein
VADRNRRGNDARGCRDGGRGLTERWQVRFSTKFFFDAGLYFPKFSLVMSYATMVPVTEPRMRIFLRFIATYLVLACLTAVFADLFWCGGDVSINWLNPLKCSSFSNPHLQKVTWTMNIVGELLLFIFPFPILNSLKFTQLREKIGLGLIFALGFFTILVSTGRFMFMIFLTNDISLSVWTTVEMCKTLSQRTSLHYWVTDGMQVYRSWLCP